MPIYNPQRDASEVHALHFAGVYTDRLVYICGKRIFFNTQVRNTTRIISAATKGNESGSDIKDLNPDDTDSSWSIIGADKEHFIIAKHDVHGEIELRHYRLDDSRMITFLHRPTPHKNVTITHVISNTDRPYVGSVFLAPKKPEDKLFSSAHGKPPLIILPHGGPHAAYSTAYSAYHTAFVLLGAAILRVKYTGSILFGSDSIDSLVGRIGTEDVEDVHYAVTALKDPGGQSLTSIDLTSR